MDIYMETVIFVYEQKGLAFHTHSKRIHACRIVSQITKIFHLIWFDLVGFYGTLTIVGYSKPNPVFTYISNVYSFDHMEIKPDR